MGAIKRPKFWNVVILIFNSVISLITTIFTTLKLPDDINNFQIALYIILIYIGSFLMIFLIYFFIYFIKLYLYIKKLENEYNSLYKHYKELKNKYNQLLNENALIPILIDDIVKKLELAVINPSIEEANFIKKVIDLLNLDKLIYDERKIEIEKE